MQFADGKELFSSDKFTIEESALAKLTLSSIIHYYNKQRANTPAELEADQHIKLMAVIKPLICAAAGAMHRAM